MKTDAPKKALDRHPDWLRVKLPVDRSNEAWLKGKLSAAGLHTVCQEARCPNLHDCFNRKTATFLLMGDTCTRHCTFCAINKGTPAPLNPKEGEELAALVKEMGLQYVVLTSVDRDDLPDGGAGHFASVIKALREQNPQLGVEVLTPDFRGDLLAVETVASENPVVFNHNVETVPSLYKRVRPDSHYQRSLSVLGHVAQNFPHIPVKSGLMLGHGETLDEVIQVMTDLRGVGVSLISIGQYLAPQNRSLKVREFLPEQVFQTLEAEAEKLGFTGWHIAPFARSSYHADELAPGSPSPFVENGGV